MLLNSLRRVLVASGLVAVTSFMASTAAFAQTVPPASQGINIGIGGSVASNLAFTASATGNAANLDLSSLPSGSPARVARVGDLRFGSNNSLGLTVIADGTFVLANSASGALTGNNINFTALIVPNTTTTPTSGYAVAPYKYDTKVATAPTTPYSLYIQYSPSTIQNPGSYAATITLTAKDN